MSQIVWACIMTPTSTGVGYLISASPIGCWERYTVSLSLSLQDCRQAATVKQVCASFTGIRISSFDLPPNKLAASYAATNI